MKVLTLFLISVVIVAESTPISKETKLSRAAVYSATSYLKPLLGSASSSNEILSTIRESTAKVAAHGEELSSYIKTIIERIAQATDGLDWQLKSMPDLSVRDLAKSSVKSIKQDITHLKSLLRKLNNCIKKEYARSKSKCEGNMKDTTTRAFDIADLLVKKIKRHTDNMPARAVECVNEHSATLQKMAANFNHSMDECGYALHQQSSSIMDKVQRNIQSCPEIIENIAAGYEACGGDSGEQSDQMNCVLDATTTGKKNLQDKINDIYKLLVALQVLFFEMGFNNQGCILNTLYDIHTHSQTYNNDFESCVKDQKPSSRKSK